MAKKKASSARKIFRATVVLAPLLALACLLFTLMLSHRLESGLLDVCARQQDGYVELVLEQINLKENRDDQEIISQIIGTLDASSNKYWTLSSDQTVLFVKDVLETNRFKGVTTATYYVSDSARAFIDSLRTNQVTHAPILIEGREYIASGVVFLCQGKPYSLCLLTNRDVLLDSNLYLGVKTQLWIVFLLVLGLLLAVPFCLALLLVRAQDREDRSQATLTLMGRRINQMNDRLTAMSLYDSRNNLWRADMLPRFLKALEERRDAPVTLMGIRCQDARAREQFLSLAHYTLDSACLRFTLEGSDLLLIFVGVGKEAATLSAIPCLSPEAQMAAAETVEAPEEGGVTAAARRVLQAVQSSGEGRDRP